MWAMAVKEFRQLRRDHRTVAMLVVMPLLLLTVFGFAASFDVDDVPTMVVGPGAQQVADGVPALFEVTTVRAAAGRAEAVAALRDGEVTVALISGSEPVALVDGTQLFAARVVVSALGRAMPVEVLFNPDLRTSTVMVPALIGLILVFVGTVATSLGVVRERQTGTLEQLAVMPLRPRDVFIGKIAPYPLVAAVDTLLIALAGVWLFDVPFTGSPLVFALGAGLFLFVTLGLGVLVSQVSQNQGQAIQLAIMTLLPQVLLSGLIFPVESMAAGIRWIAYLLPLTYFIQVSRGVMVRGAPLEALVLPLGMLAVLGTVVFGLAVLRFRRDLAPAKARHPVEPDPSEADVIAAGSGR